MRVSIVPAALLALLLSSFSCTSLALRSRLRERTGANARALLQALEGVEAGTELSAESQVMFNVLSADFIREIGLTPTYTKGDVDSLESALGTLEYQIASLALYTKAPVLLFAGTIKTMLIAKLVQGYYVFLLLKDAENNDTPVTVQEKMEERLEKMEEALLTSETMKGKGDPNAVLLNAIVKRVEGMFATLMTTLATTTQFKADLEDNAKYALAITNLLGSDQTLLLPVTNAITTVGAAVNAMLIVSPQIASPLKSIMKTVQTAANAATSVALSNGATALAAVKV